MSNLPDAPLTPYQAANLLEALKLVPDTGDWYGELRLKCEAILMMEPHAPLPLRGIVLSPEECATLKVWHDGTLRDTFPEPELRDVFVAGHPVGAIMAKVASRSGRGEIMSAARRHEAWIGATVVVEINDPDVVERITGPEGDEWRRRSIRCTPRRT